MRAITVTRFAPFVSVLAFASIVLSAAAATASAGPVWALRSVANTAAAPGAQVEFRLQPTNVGDLSTGTPNDNGTPEDPNDDFFDPIASRIDVVLPDGLTASEAFAPFGGWDCSAPASPDPLEPGDQAFSCVDEVHPFPANDSFGVPFAVIADVDPGAAGVRTATFQLSGGGVADPVSTFDPTLITAQPLGFGVELFDGQLTGETGEPFTQAGGHPYAAATQFEFNISTDPREGPLFPIESFRQVAVDLPPGLVGNVTALGECSIGQLVGSGINPKCPPSSQVGKAFFSLGGSSGGMPFPRGFAAVYNMIPPTGAAARLAFSANGSLITLDASLRSESDDGLTVTSNAPQTLSISGVDIDFWGIPADPAHDSERSCPGVPQPGCDTESQLEPLLRLPTSCTPDGVGLQTGLRAFSWENPGHVETASFTSHLPPDYPAPPELRGKPQGPTGCDDLFFEPQITAQPGSKSAETPTGLTAHLEMPNPGLLDPEGTAASDIKKTIVTLPEGVTLNPSQADGLAACTPAQFKAETVESEFGASCPGTSKIGSVSIKSPLLEETVDGSLFLAQPDDPSTTTPGAENPFDSLLALYIVAKNFQRGIIVKLSGEVSLSKSGRITTTFEDLPQLPFETFDLSFREGGRAPLVTPQACGTYTTKAEFTPWSDPSRAVTTESSFQITSGVGGGPCPSGGLPPFKPGLIAGTRNNNAGSYSPFDLRLFRQDGEQEYTHFSVKLPPGLSGKLAGVPFCSDQAILAAKAESRTGAQELASPSCPEASYVGRTLVGAGVGSVLTYAPGRVYLAGPYNGSALSIAAITAAKVGPFDLGTVVVRQALRIDPVTAEVFIDATGSDPIPHIIDGVTTHLRDIRVYVERPNFTLNPTNCAEKSIASTVLGSGLDFASAADDEPLVVSTRFQAANCLNLGFKPKLGLRLLGATKRGANPKFRAVLRMRGEGEANIARAQVTLPRSAFLDQSHIRTVCTRAQFAQDACPAGSVYGYAKAITPLLDEPLQGPVYLRSSEHKLPDLVAVLKNGKIEIDLVGRIDSSGEGRIRNTFETVPDAPVTKFILTMQGGNKGLLVNSTNLCKGKNRAIARFDGQNGKVRDFKPVVRAGCGGKGAGGKARRSAHRSALR